MTDEVMACEHCDSSSVSKDTAKSHSGSTNVDGPEFYCYECGERVGVVWREPIGPYAHTDSQSGWRECSPTWTPTRWSYDG